VQQLARVLQVSEDELFAIVRHQAAPPAVAAGQ
jgi:hypothetical protein